LKAGSTSADTGEAAGDALGREDDPQPVMAIIARVTVTNALMGFMPTS
jgi:redox-regulated HSP33 family molecular chaperone